MNCIVGKNYFFYILARIWVLGRPIALKLFLCSLELCELLSNKLELMRSSIFTYVNRGMSVNM